MIPGAAGGGGVAGSCDFASGAAGAAGSCGTMILVRENVHDVSSSRFPLA